MTWSCPAAVISTAGLVELDEPDTVPPLPIVTAVTCPAIGLAMVASARFARAVARAARSLSIVAWSVASVAAVTVRLRWNRSSRDPSRSILATRSSRRTAAYPSRRLVGLSTQTVGASGCSSAGWPRPAVPPTSVSSVVSAASTDFSSAETVVWSASSVAAVVVQSPELRSAVQAVFSASSAVFAVARSVSVVLGRDDRCLVAADLRRQRIAGRCRPCRLPVGRGVGVGDAAAVTNAAVCAVTALVAVAVAVDSPVSSVDSCSSAACRAEPAAARAAASDARSSVASRSPDWTRCLAAQTRRPSRPPGSRGRRRALARRAGHGQRLGTAPRPTIAVR